ncbi:hypothetical protein IMCC3317_00210 [Kordia antarctica]|uniref:Uncharacterized protein n=1 Tax=Kordia antarctica TaxID=1218801 RepID=A0A7L4ZCL4_9FLAO|nr:hypothetical protein [Kordia antarctica]QHI34678.1 hypothetical protein IMCC3317_00210 [Kordia antarctica]
MYKQYFGVRKKMRFDSPEEYYETLGYIAKSDGSCDLYREENQNQGAWGPEIRMNCYKNLHKFPAPLKRKFTKGRGKKVLHRINCNEFIQDLLDNHNFKKDEIQDVNTIRNTIPAQYQVDFDRGLAL